MRKIGDAAIGIEKTRRNGFQVCTGTETAVVRRDIDEITEQTSGQCCQTGAIAEGLEHVGVFRASGKHGRRQVLQTGTVVEAFVK